MSSPITKILLSWYKQHKRHLPWRDHADPYAVWVSEIMLQQTRVESVIPYFKRWMERFPTITALASASQQDVLAAWEGLGYYSRARNLHLAAQEVINKHDGRLPESAAELRLLPGVGRYTAAAVASIAFGQDEPALDGNIRRVLARLFDMDIPLRTPQAERTLWQLVEAHMPSGQAGDYNQALMDLGATICTARAPQCEMCPLVEFCQAKAGGIQEDRPVVEPKKRIPHHTVTAAVMERDGAVLIARRPAKGLLGGMWEFPGGKVEQGEDLPTCLQRELREELGIEATVGDQIGTYRHAYTHFRVTVHAFYCQLKQGEPRPIQVSAVQWVQPGELGEYPMGKVDRQIAMRLIQEESQIPDFEA